MAYVEQVLDHARDEYLYIYSIYVLEASTSNRLTYFFPPLVSSYVVDRPSTQKASFLHSRMKTTATPSDVAFASINACENFEAKSNKLLFLIISRT